MRGADRPRGCPGLPPPPMPPCWFCGCWGSLRRDRGGDYWCVVCARPTWACEGCGLILVIQWKPGQGQGASRWCNFGCLVASLRRQAAVLAAEDRFSVG